MTNRTCVACPRIRVFVLLALAIGVACSGLQMQDSGQATGSLLSLPLLGSAPLPIAPIASAAPYDEQVGVTFTQDFPSLAFNVTAVNFTDGGIGPGYLVNGLTDQGYWYQVGLSYNWPMTDGTVNMGFSMNYEVFSPSLASIYPTSGGGGIQFFNGTVNTGDIVLLSLSFSSRSVLMQAIDLQTRSIAIRSFIAYASNRVFVGLRSSLSQSGFFSGLMTEQYHSYPYNGAGQPVTYTAVGLSISSAWMWMDEWNTNTGQPVFDDNTTTPVLLDQSNGHYFSSNGTAEVATAHRLVTGLNPVSFPTLLSGSQTIGKPGDRISINLTIEDANGAVVRLENVTIRTSFARYNFTLKSPFTFGPGLGDYNLTIGVPSNVGLGSYNLTINVLSWQYLDSEAQTWISLHQETINETLLLTNSPPPANPPNSPGPNPPSSGQGPSSSTNRTTLSPSSLLNLLRSMIAPVLSIYIALGLLSVALVIRQERRRSVQTSRLGLGFCTNCGRQLSPDNMTCPNCNFSVINVDKPNQSSMAPQPGQTSPASGTAGG